MANESYMQRYITKHPKLEASKEIKLQTLLLLLNFINGTINTKIF